MAKKSRGGSAPRSMAPSRVSKASARMAKDLMDIAMARCPLCRMRVSTLRFSAHMKGCEEARKREEARRIVGGIDICTD